MSKILTIAVLNLILSNHLYAKSQCGHKVLMELKQCLSQKISVKECPQSELCSEERLFMVKAVIKTEKFVKIYEEAKKISASMKAPFENCNK